MTDRPSPSLCLGTVQFGVAYGIAGSGARVPEAEAAAILAAAWEAGIRRLDTAPGYGDIEERLIGLTRGRGFEIVTKIPKLPAELATSVDAARFVRDALDRSRSRLGETICGILFHAADDLVGPHGSAAWDAAAEWCARERLPLGLSVYGPEALADWAGEHRVAMAQLPANAFDQRISGAALPEHIEITARSAFLQGLLLMDESEAARRLPAASAGLAAWNQLCHNEGLAPIVAALGVVKGLSRIDFCAVGVETAVQLSQIVEAWAAAPALSALDLATADPAVIDPRTWSAAA
ncbi:aldo/keto reductase [Tsuneonella amylolytica]|uniref:aldo/keto reductase n=1 Tax=Tsuneonella amylolytica TaxID=2338327 RepID=UPI000EAA99AC|nr:aldo/keto reductase [Tsuneonella amylolytica]